MDVGIPWWIGAGPPEDGIQQAAEIGVDFVEISLDAPWPETLDAARLRAQADAAGIEIGFHAPWRTQALAHPREALAQAARNVAQGCIDLARAAGGAYIVFHVDARDFGGFPDPSVVHDGLQQAQASLRALTRSAGDTLSLLVENTSSPMGTPDEVARFVDPLPSAGFCYDPGHAELVELDAIDGATSDATAWIDALGDRFQLLHAMDRIHTDGGIIDHLIPGAGEAKWEQEIQTARTAGCRRVLIEAFYRSPDKEPARAKDFAEAAERVRSLG